MLLKKIQKVNQPIGVFDSGIGGLSVLLELYKSLPSENYIFLADQANVPYGEKTEEELKNIVINAGNFLYHKGVKMIVVACNTATCYGIDGLRKNLPIPIVGTVPAVKPACEKSKTKNIGVISTPTTSKSKTMTRLIEEHARGINVINVGCQGLEDSVEKGDLFSIETTTLIGSYLNIFRGANIDQLVLGCTHYPFLKDKISDYLGDNVEIIDSGRAIAIQTARILSINNIKNQESNKGLTTFYTTGNTANFSKVASRLISHPVETLKIKL